MIQSHETGMRRALLLMLAFNALSQIGGGIGVLTGGVRPPLSLLSTTPFTDYTVPGLTLAVITGGISLLALLLVWLAGHLTGDFAGIVAGCTAAGWIVGEVLLLGFISPSLQTLYFLTGLLAAGLAGALWLADWERMHPHQPQQRHSPA